MVAQSENLGNAFAIVLCLAGAATAIGASLVYSPTLIRFASQSNLAAAIGLSAGAMIYISFVDFWAKAYGCFGSAGWDESHSFWITTGCYFFGCFLTVMFGVIEYCLVGNDHSYEVFLDKLQHLENVEQANESEGAESDDHKNEDYEYNPPPPRRDFDDNEGRNPVTPMDVQTAFAVLCHNFPEGLATYMACISHPAAGIILAIAIAIHKNIPEGICVALPIFSSRDNRCQAIGFAILCGMSEPVAAIVGWAILAGSTSGNLYGFLYGTVSGMMTLVAVKELLPTATKYDPNDAVVSHFFVLGMVIMGLTLILLIV